VKTALAVTALLIGQVAAAQDGTRPREFAEFRGTWTLEKSERSAGLSVHVAQTLVISIAPAEITVVKDKKLSETYRFDGSETPTKEPKTGALLDPRYSFRLVAGLLALTTKTGGAGPNAAGVSTTQILTDAYSLTSFDTLRVERQISVLQDPPGSLRTLGPRNATEIYTYRRAANPPAR
jgi:hypothetical protein